jgi:2,3,4,5-tetrahydropyridine-2-carboxylate N-succinyltransferase
MEKILINGKAWGYGLATVSLSGTIINVWFPQPRLGESNNVKQDKVLCKKLSSLLTKDELRGVYTEVVKAEVDLSLPIVSTPDAYLRLHLLSHLLVRPNTINLDGLFTHLPIYCSTNKGTVTLDSMESNAFELRKQGILCFSIDKFPKLTDYVIPKKVRISNTSNIRLGAHLVPGTSVVGAAWVSFNAGTLGKSLIEGRISQGVVVGSGSQIGAGASTMGTISGEGKQVVTIGKRVLIGANAGVGISIGDDSVVEAGLYITHGSKVNLIDGGNSQQVRASELNGVPRLLFRRNSLSGAIEALVEAGKGIKLNMGLHE